MVIVESLRLSSPDAYLRYVDLPGADPPLVFAHGLGCAASIDFVRVAADSKLRGRRVLLPDLLGHGYSDAPADFPYTMDAHARTVSALLDHLSVKGAVVVGHSMGGSVAITLAAERPDLVSRLIVAEPNLDPGGGIVSTSIAEQTESAFVASGHAALLERFWTEGWVTRVATFRAASSTGLYRSAVALVAGTSPSWRELPYGVALPRVYVEGDRSHDEEESARMREHRIPLLVVPNSGHDMPFDNPSGFAAAIADGLTVARSKAEPTSVA